MSEHSDDNPQTGLKSHASLKNSDIMIRCAHPSGQLKLLSRYRSAESTVSKNETASSLTEQSEIMLERKRQLPEGRMKSVKKWGGVLFKSLLLAETA